MPVPPGIATSYLSLEKQLSEIRDKSGIDQLVPSGICVGLGVNYQEMIDTTTHEIILVGQNLLGPIGGGVWFQEPVGVCLCHKKSNAFQFFLGEMAVCHAGLSYGSQ